MTPLENDLSTQALWKSCFWLDSFTSLEPLVRVSNAEWLQKNRTSHNYCAGNFQTIYSTTETQKRLRDAAIEHVFPTVFV